MYRNYIVIDPDYEDDGPYYSDLHRGWFFYDETGDSMGPYPTRAKALEAIEDYVFYLDHGKAPTSMHKLYRKVKKWVTINIKNVTNK